MTITTVPPFSIPAMLDMGAGAPAFGATLLMDAAGEKAAMIFQAPKAGNIHILHFRTGTVGTAVDTDLRLETVDLATGDPSGTLAGTNSNVTVPSASLVLNTVISATLTADLTVTRGQLLAAVWAPTGTPNFRVATVGLAEGVQRFPYLDLFTSSAWAKNNVTYPLLGIEYSDGSFAYTPGVYPFSAINNHSINNGTDPDEIALRVSVPVGMRVAGAWLYADVDGDADVILYSSDAATPLVTGTVDKDVRGGTSAGGPHRVLFSSTVDLTANTDYFLSVKPSSATSLILYSYDVPTAAMMDQIDGQAYYYREAVNGTWDAAITTRRPLMGLTMNGIDVPAGGTPRSMIHSE